MEVHGDYVCPRCKQGVLVQRKGKNGVFWGCSNYPKCRLTTNDKDGKPDMDEAKSRAQGGDFSRGAAGGGMRPTGGAARTAGGRSRRWSSARQNAPAPARSGVSGFAPAQTAYADHSGGSEPSAADWDELNTLFGDPYARKQSRNWGDKPKYSASPMEKMKPEAEAKGKDGKPKEKILCPNCKEGHLRKIRGKNGVFWGCSNYPRCTATFDDEGGKPVLW